MQPEQPTGVEAHQAGTFRLDGGTDRLQSHEHTLPGVGHPGGVRRKQRQPRAARQRLAHPHPRPHAERLRGGRDLADQLLAPRLGRQRRGFAQQRATVAGGDGEREPRKQHGGDHHEHMFASRRGERKLRGAAARR